MNQIDEIAALLFWLEDWSDRHDPEYQAFCDKNNMGYAEYPEFEDARDMFSGHVSAIESNKVWKDGKHSGDCTAVPMSCARCFVEEYRQKSQQWLDDYNGIASLFSQYKPDIPREETRAYKTGRDGQ